MSLMLAPLAALFYASGFAALVYQVLWVRLLGLVFGVTLYAASTVLAAFMAGLALGSFLAGRFADRVRHPLRWLAGAEVIIGLSALATPAALSWLTGLYRELHAAAPDNLALLTLARFVCSSLVLLVPTTMMGATLPLVLRSAVVRDSEVGRRAALLYATNTAGALCGVLAAGYVLITALGIETTFRIGALVNFAVAVAAAGLSRSIDRSRARSLPGAPPAPADAAADQAIDQRGRRAVLFVFGLSGFVALALEVIWIRALLMFLPATTYVFTTILAVVLGGLAAGGALAALVLRRRRDPLARLATLEAAIGLAALLSIAALAWTYSAGWRTGAALQGSALAILPTTLLMGVAFPIGLHAWAAGARRIGSRTGTFYAVNVCGSVLGAIAAGFYIVPLLGVRGGLIALAAASLGASLLLTAVQEPRPRRGRLLRAATLTAVFAAAAVLVPDPLDAVLARRYPGEQVLWRHEGAQSTVTVHHREDGTRVLYLDGLHQANDSVGMLATHRLIGTLAMALHPDPRRVLVVGLGGGATAGAAARFGDAALDVVELSPGVVQAADWFREATGDVLRRPNVRLRVDDGRNHVLLTANRYDVITADIIQPFHAGAGSLYSVEYFTLARQALADDGLMLQWIGHRPRSQYHLIARTFQQVFPETTAWADGTLLVGTKQPLRLDPERYRQRLAEPELPSALTSVGIAGFGGLLRLYTAGPEALREFLGPGPVLTDDRPLVEYFLTLPRNEPEVDTSRLAQLGSQKEEGRSREILK